MRDSIFRVTARIHVAMIAARHEFPERLARLARALRDEAGQDIVEYGGILVLVALILTVLITTTNIPSTIASDISSVINSIFTSGASTAKKSGG
jgi:Flp pilus assembly pilin Flp